MNEFILIAEDDENDRLLVERAFKRIPDGFNVRLVPNGEEVIHYLAGTSDYTDRLKHPFPRAIFLDLKMPRVSGFEVLQWLRDNPSFSVVPTIIWSSSDLPQDITRAYKLGANCYLVKPPSLEEIYDLLSLTVRFWCQCAKPPVPCNLPNDVIRMH